LIVPISSSFSPDDPLLTSNSVIDAPYLNKLRFRLSGFDHGNETSDQKKILYIKRETYPAGDGAISRSIINQDEVIAYLEALGATVVSPENLTAEDQRKIFHSADIVVAMAGSALANAVFCRPGTAIILICQNRIVSPAYFGAMFGELGLNYAVVACPPVDGTNPHPSHLSVTVDIPMLREAMEWSNSAVTSSR
jgi:capsular polysaccharide biosynthesis protein